MIRILFMKKKVFDEIPHIESDRLVLKKIEDEDSDALDELRNSKVVAKYLPTFLFEYKYDDIHVVIDKMYSKSFADHESVFMGIYTKDDMEFCGIAEFYGFKDSIHKVSIGIRLREKAFGKGIATEAIGMMTDYLTNETDTEIIAASTLPDNSGSAKALVKNGFQLVVHNSDEDWGFDEPLPTDKWIL